MNTMTPQVSSQLVFRASYQKLIDPTCIEGIRHYPQLVMPPKAASTEPLSFTRPGGCNTRGYLSMHASRIHSFFFNRAPQMDDLGDIAPENIDGFDLKNYRPNNGYLFSKHDPRFMLADIDKLNEASITAMLGLDLCFSMRTTFFGKPISVYLMGDHTWAIWGWAEAAARGELAPTDNVLIHCDDHEDIGITQKTMELANINVGLNLANVGLVVNDYVCTPSDPKGIGSFIGPAASTNFLGAYFWVYGQGPAAPKKDSHVYTGHTKELFRHGAFRYRYHSLPFLQIEAVSEQCESGSRIFDYDIDVAGMVNSVKAVARPHFRRPGWIDCATIAISPQYGPKLNHVRKVIALLGMLKKRR